MFIWGLLFTSPKHSASSLKCYLPQWIGAFRKQKPDKSRERLLLISCYIRNSLGKEGKGKTQVEKIRAQSINQPYSFILEAIIGEGNGTPLQYSCLENPMDRGAW